jgi:hypothetical protein
MFSTWEKISLFFICGFLLLIIIADNNYKVAKEMHTKVECNRVCQPHNSCEDYSDCGDCKAQLIEFICKDGTTFYKVPVK